MGESRISLQLYPPRPPPPSTTTGKISLRTSPPPFLVYSFPLFPLRRLRSNSQLLLSPLLGIFSLKRSTTDSAKKGEKSLPLPLFEGHKVDSSDRVTYSMGGRKFRNFRSFPSPHFFAKCRYLDSPATFPPPPTQVFCAPLLPPLGGGVGGVCRAGCPQEGSKVF